MYSPVHSEADAIALMALAHPNDEAGFTVQLWKIDSPVCRGRGHQIPQIMMLDGSVTKGDLVTCELCRREAGGLQVTLEAYRDYISL